MIAVARDQDWRRLVILGPARQRQPRPWPLPLTGESPPAPLACMVEPAAQRVIYRHSRSTLAREVGGLMLGHVFEEQGRFLVNVIDALPARHTAAGPAHLTFTGDTWLDLAERRSELPDLMTVGWYHSHPGLGIFLSGSDTFIHRHYFADQPWYVALVVDPLSGEQGIFGWQDQRLVRFGLAGGNAQVR